MADLLRRTRIAAGLTQTQMAGLIGAAQSVISKYEQGAREPRASVLLQWLQVAGLTTHMQSGQPTAVPWSTEVVAARLRARVLSHLRAQGFKVKDGRLIAPVADKDRLRRLHREAVTAQIERARGGLERFEHKFLPRLAFGDEIDVHRIRPRLILVDQPKSLDGLTWRWCSLHWSIPVSSGYGRRLRFLVVDEGHDNKVMGLIGLADPVYALACRDNAIGWNAASRRARLASVMDAFVLGAVPPYSSLCGGKLMALLATSAEVREIFAKKYGHRRTVIADRDPNAQLALVTTSSALGRSSVYNRLKRDDGAHVMYPIGYTRGTGDFHFSGAIYEELAMYASLCTTEGDTHRNAKWGNGFRNRREVIQRALRALELDPSQLRIHGVQRQVFLAPLASNSLEWLRGERVRLRWNTRSADEHAAWWRKRWALPRSESVPEWQKFDPFSWALY
ncbi:Druantia anti-phage system protein DruA [Mycobacteroides abscessus]|uniref:Druantia anti-phage system protein DruA n=1 Tax=Mycobacteroides abscessus TaxID=36809 RepID=UPI001041F165|nr:Druantia anti-phage system protein DruA [Mycobacteroides abscessus]